MAIYHASCRDAKTAEEYLLKCLFKAEDERDEAIAYCDGVRQAEEERIKAAEEAQKEFEEKAKNAPVFSVKETKTVKYKVASAYKFCDKDYGLADVKTLTDALNLDDEKLYEWACKNYSGEKGWYSFRPINRTEKTFDYTFVYYGDYDETDLHVFVSEEGWPESFETLMVDEAKIDKFCLITEDGKIKALAITDLRKELKDAISRLLKRADNNES
ncbi:hypothetical protein [Lancefieldella rimae]